MKWLRNKIKIVFGLYDINDLQIGGHCGCCGEYMAKEIFCRKWSWGLCQNCINFKEIGEVSIGCISPEVRDLLNTIMEHWEKYYTSFDKVPEKHKPGFYGFAYWLVRWSGLVQPIKRK